MCSSLTDEVLWQNTGDGDHEAFSCIFNRYQVKLYRFIKSRVASEDDAKDILQDIFISLWKNRGKTEFNASLSAYLHGAAKYAIIDWQIKNKTMLSRVELLLEENTVSAQTHSIEKELIAAELKEEIMTLVDRLPHTVRTVFRMSRIEQKSNSEIAEELQLSGKTVRNSLSLALNFLRDHMDSNMGTFTVLVIVDRIFSK